MQSYQSSCSHNWGYHQLVNRCNSQGSDWKQKKNRAGNRLSNILSGLKRRCGDITYIFGLSVYIKWFERLMNLVDEKMKSLKSTHSIAENIHYREG